MLVKSIDRSITKHCAHSIGIFLYSILFLIFFVRLTEADDRIVIPSEHEGRAISEVVVDNPTNLSNDELLKGLECGVGQPLSTVKIRQYIDRLNERQIFEEITVESTLVNDNVVLRITLRPFYLINSVTFSGNSSFDMTELRRAALIPPGKALAKTDLAQAAARILNKYHLAGFYECAVNVASFPMSVPPYAQVRFSIDEGYRSKIGEVVINGIFPAEIAALKDSFIANARGSVASDQRILELGRELLVSLRKEGYLEASVRKVKSEYQPLTGDVEVYYNVTIKDPLSIVFTGNEIFTTAELLDLLKIETRTVPFSANAIPNFVREIERFYQQHGYLFTTVDYRRLPSEGSRTRYEVTIVESEQFQLKRITFLPQLSVEPEELRQVMQTSSAGFWPLSRWYPGFIIDEQLESDVDDIRRYYEQRGYFNVSVSRQIKVLDDSHNVELLIEIAEGEQTKIKSVDTVWEHLYSDKSTAQAERLLSLTPQLYPGTPFDEGRIETARREFEGRIMRLGYPLTSVETNLDRHSGTVEYVVDLGDQVTVGKIVNQGNVLTHDYVVNQELTLSPGDFWNTEKVRDAERALYGLGLFRAVTIEPLDGAFDSGTEDLVIRVTERDTGSFQVGAEVNSEDGLHLIGEVRQRNFQGNGNGLLFGIDGYFKSGDRLFDAGRIRAAYIDPRIGATNIEMYNELFLQSSINLNQEFSYDRIGLSTLFRYQITEAIKANVLYTAYQERVYDVPDDIVIGSQDSGSLFYSIISNELEYDKRDDPFNTRKGYRGVFRWRAASEAMGSEADFVGVIGQATNYTPLSTQLILVNNLTTQALIPHGDSDVIPLNQRIFLGGRQSLRGFSPNAVAPRGADGNVVGGDTSIVCNTELQYSITDSLMTSLFLDVGQARLEYKGDFSGDPHGWEDLRYSPGLGIHYRTPIGPLGIEYGMALDREYGERFGRLNFSIGSAF